MNCPQCGAHTEVKDTRIKTDHVVRRRLCFNMHTFQTKEASVNPFQRANPKLLEKMHQDAIRQRTEDALL